MNQISTLTLRFFDQLSMDADKDGANEFLVYMRQAVLRFFKEESKKTAYEVYREFFESYQFEGERMSLLLLLDKLRAYEENAAQLTKKQRDHFIHSVNVFLLGLAIYESNSLYRAAFLTSVYEGEDYVGRFTTPREEFFFRWGLAALCHDIGYPVEIITNQINEFVNFMSKLKDDDPEIVSRVEYDRFGLINSIPECVRKRDFIKAYYDRYESCVYVDLLKPVDLLAHKLHLTLGLDIGKIKDKLDGYVADSGRIGRVDHGFFSAVILLKWYGYFVQTGGLSPDMLYFPVLDSASAILLHNFYSIGLVKNEKRPNAFSLGPLSPQSHPIAFLLILCDELQEWNRKPYGSEDKKKNHTYNVTITMDEGRLDVTYLVETGTMPEEFTGKKIGLFNQLLDIKAIYPEDISIGCESVEELRSKFGYADDDGLTAPLARASYERLAIAIHDRYNRTSKRLHPEKLIKYPNFSQLPDDKKYYNLRTARELPVMLSAVGCEIRPLTDGEDCVRAFTKEEVEVLAELEHARWMRNRREQGWVYGPVRDKTMKVSPYLVPYEQLADPIKELDREPCRDIPALLEPIGLGVYKKRMTNVQEFSPAEVERMARIIHERYNELTRKTKRDIPLLSFDELTPDKQNSNRRQARGIPNKLAHIGCVLLPAGTEGHGEPIRAFSRSAVEMLAVIEHDEWIGERLKSGWTYAPERNDAKKENPYMIPYDDLSELIKEYDRDTIRHIPDLAAAGGYAIYPAQAL